MAKKEDNRTQGGISEKQVYGNESFGIPSDCTKKQKMSGFKLTCYIVIVAVLCTAVYSGFRTATSYLLPDITFDKTDEPLLYIKDGLLTVKSENDRKGKTMTNAVSVGNNKGTHNIFITADGKNIFYGGNSVRDGAYSLFYRHLSDDDSKTNTEDFLIDSGVTRFKAHPKGRFVLYLKGTRLYFSDLVSSRVIAVDVTDFYLSKNNQQIIFYKDGGRMYVCPVAENFKPVMVDEKIDKLLSEKDEYSSIYYIKQGSLYHKQGDREKVLIAQNIYDGIMLDNFVYFSIKEKSSYQFSEYVTDDMKSADKKLGWPDRMDYIITDTLGRKVLDEEAYLEARRMYSQKLARDEIRSFFEKNTISSEEYVLYSVEDDKIKKIDDRLVDGELEYYSCKKITVYKKWAKPENKILLSELSSVEEAKQKVTEFINAPFKESMQVLAKDKLPYMGIEEFPLGTIEISTDGEYLYCIEKSKKGTENVLVRYSVASRALKDRKVLKEGVTDFAVDGADSLAVVVFENNTIGLCIDREYTHLSDSSSDSFFYVDKAMFFYDEYSQDTKKGQLKMFYNGKIKLIDINVSDFDVRNLKTISYIKRTGNGQYTEELYLKSGNKKKKIDSSVQYILN